MIDENQNQREILRCSFCGKTANEVKKLIAGPNGIYICDECVRLCDEIIAEEMLDENYDERDEEIHLIKPEAMKAKLDEYVVGQDEAKKVLSVAVYNHYKRILSSVSDDVVIQKSNVLLLGPTGSGKTLLASTLAKFLNVPFAIADATTLTEAGYVGEDVENILLRLIQAADGDINRAEHGIIYIDEIDKITRKSENTSITRDVSGEGVQQALLKIIEGTIAAVPPQGGRKHPQQECIPIDTTNILFICGGAFDGLEKLIERRMDKTPIGFNIDDSKSLKIDGDKTKLFENTLPEDLIKFGIIPELVGRVPIIVNLEPLDKEALINILTVPKDSLIKQYKKLLSMDNVELIFDDDAIEAIACEALSRKTGARGLRGVLESAMIDVMYHVPSDESIKSCRMTKDAILKKGNPKVTRKVQKKSDVAKVKKASNS